MKRVEFVEKTAEEVGDGTAWPMLVTMEQLAEILYRVKDAWFTAGGFDYYLGDEAIGLIGPSIAPPASPLNNNWAESDGGRSYYVDSTRGYTSSLPSESEFVMPADYADYFGEEYTYTPSVLGSELRAWDISTNERGMWLPNLEDPEISGVSFPGFAPNPSIQQLTTGLSNFTSAAGGIDSSDPFEYAVPTIDTPGWWFEGVEADTSGGAGSSFYLTGEVAWVDTNGSGNPFDPANELYLGCYFFLSRTDGSDFCDVVSDESFIPFGYEQVGTLNLNIALSTSTVTALLYVAQAVIAAGGTFSATDFELTVQSWWPYAKPAGPVWNSATGAKL
jgi:hypothetical protein